MKLVLSYLAVVVAAIGLIIAFTDSPASSEEPKPQAVLPKPLVARSLPNRGSLAETTIVYRDEAGIRAGDMAVALAKVRAKRQVRDFEAFKELVACLAPRRADVVIDASVVPTDSTPYLRVQVISGEFMGCSGYVNFYAVSLPPAS